MGGTTHLETDVEEPFSEVEWWIQQKNLVAGMTKLWAWRTRVSTPFARCGPKDIYHRSTIGRSMHCKPMVINNKTITQMAEIFKSHPYPDCKTDWNTNPIRTTA